MFISAGEMESFAFSHSIGIGSINVAINLTQLILKENPQMLIFIGSAGSYNTDIPLLSIIESSTASHIEISMCEGKSYTPIDNVIDILWENEIQENSLNVSRETSKYIINSSDYITTDPKSADYFLKHRIHYENMEFYSVLSVAKTFMIPAKGIFCITNYTDQYAHDNFLKNSQAANAQLDHYVRTHYARYL